MKLIINMFFILVSITFASAEVGKVTVLKLNNLVELKIEEVLVSRSAPWMYYNQAMESIPIIYPNSKIITKIKTEILMSNTDLYYSLVSFVENEKSSYVILGGNFISKDRAWSYSAEAPIKKYEETMRLILIAIGTTNL